MRPMEAPASSPRCEVMANEPKIKAMRMPAYVPVWVERGNTSAPPGPKAKPRKPAAKLGGMKIVAVDSLQVGVVTSITF